MKGTKRLWYPFVAGLALLFMACPNMTEDDGTVIDYVDRVSVAPASKYILVAGTIQLTATVEPNSARDRSLTWASSDSSVATVSETGLVTGVQLGKAIITATANDGTKKSGSCAITVSTEIAATGVLVPPTATVYDPAATGKADILTLSYTLVPAESTDNVTWSGGDALIATVDPVSGIVSAVAAGTVTIRATADSGVFGECVVTVSANPLLARYSFEPDTYSGSAFASQEGISSVGMTITLGAGVADPKNLAGKNGDGIFFPGSTAAKGGTLSSILPAFAQALTFSAWIDAGWTNAAPPVFVFGGDWSQAMHFDGASEDYFVDLPNLTLAGIGSNIWPGSGYGNLEGGYSWYSLFSNDGAADAGWVYVTIAVDAVDGTISFYRNGSLMIRYSGLAAQAAAMVGIAKNGSWKIGDIVFNDPAIKMDGVRIYAGALSAGFIANLYDGGNVQ